MCVHRKGSTLLPLILIITLIMQLILLLKKIKASAALLATDDSDDNDREKHFKVLSMLQIKVELILLLIELNVEKIPLAAIFHPHFLRIFPWLLLFCREIFLLLLCLIANWIFSQFNKVSANKSANISHLIENHIFHSLCSAGDVDASFAD